MKTHYRHDAESELGVGMAYMEVTDGWPTRQVEVYGESWRWADEEHPEWLADQPLEVLGLRDSDAIAPDEFERVWREALKRCPSPS